MLRQVSAFCSHIFDCACLRRKAYCYQRASKLRKNCILQKAFLKTADGRMHTPHPIPLDRSLAISCRSQLKSLAFKVYFSHLAPLILFFFTKKHSQKEGGMVQCPPLLNTLLQRIYKIYTALVSIVQKR